MKHLFIFLFASLFIIACGGEQNRKVQIQTEYGNMTVELFNTTPLHRDNFVKLVKEGFYDDLLFHRVMNNFMIQGGDPDSRGAEPGRGLGSGGPGYRIKAEIGEKHFKGRLSAARTPDGVNPERESSGSQFFVVDGNITNENMLNQTAAKEGFTYTEQEKEIYRTVGGAAFLDGQYTVFGQVVEGLDVIDKIAVVQTDSRDRPDQDVKMKIVLLN